MASETVGFGTLSCPPTPELAGARSPIPSVESYVSTGDSGALSFWERAGFQQEHTQIRRFLTPR
ncbi:unannotated protein [freshwater metagenome]|uniref:Unannotated protein n=1 Tax=freshwater metagenome TaxID=449393 RepID=A0A6J6SI65_9ZZZZ|nr:hypothetical protein [Actinomycetota bacterium]